MKQSELNIPEIPDGVKLEWVNGVLTLVKEDYNEQLADHTFQVGEKAILARDTVFEQGMGLCSIAAGNEVEIISATHLFNNLYKIKFENATTVIHGCDLNKPSAVVRPVTDRIKTFEDAYEWCARNDRETLCMAYQEFNAGRADTEDVVAYLKLRIITAALNEGWEPCEGAARYAPLVTSSVSLSMLLDDDYEWYPKNLCFKTRELAQYAGKRFCDIYTDFCDATEEHA